MYYRFSCWWSFALIFLYSATCCGQEAKTAPQKRNVATAANYVEANFLPILRLHPDENNLPSTVSWLLPRAELWYESPKTRILKKGELNDYNLHTQVFNGQKSGGGEQVTKFYIDYPKDGDLAETRHGNIDSFGCYVHISRMSDPLEIQYYFYFPYNGSIAPILDIAHEGDWEHVTVRLTLDRSRIDKIFYHAHSGGKWVPAAGHVNAQGRPIVYCARHTHGLYPGAGKWNTAAPGVQDETKDGGPEIDYNAEFGWRSLDVVEPSFEWVNFNGRWGSPGTFEASSGFPGPKFQKEWKEDPRE